MKHQTINLVKFKNLAMRLGQPMCFAVGVLESLWIFAQIQARDGDLSAFDATDIAGWIEWPGDENHLIESLVSSGWLDRTNDGRLLIHDWQDHKPQWLKGVEARSAKTEPSAEPSSQLGSEPSAEPSRSPSRQPPNLTQPNPTQPNPTKPNTPLSPPKGGDVPADRPERTRKPKRANRDRTYSPAFEDVWGQWRPYGSPKGDKARAADLFEAMPDEDQVAFAAAAQAYCDERHMHRCKTEHMSTVLNGDWREYLVAKRREANPEYTPGFVSFWSNYPHRGVPEEKFESFAQWVQLSEFDQDNMPRAVENYKRSKSVKDGYAKSAFNFLAKRIFADYVELTEDQLNEATLDPTERERIARRKAYEAEMAEHKRQGEQIRARQGMPPITPQLKRV